MKYIIDAPTPFDTLATWQAFRRSLNNLDEGAEEVAEAKSQADAKIAELRARI